MRKLILILFLLPLIGQAQTDTVNNFKAENGEIIWQKVFTTKLPASEVFKTLKDKGVFKEAEQDSVKITGDLRQLDADYKGAGYSALNTPSFIGNHHFDGFATVEYKDGRYRATIKRIVLTEAITSGFYKMGATNNLEIYVIKSKSTIKPMFKGSPSKILDHTFTKLFTISEDKSDW